MDEFEINIKKDFLVDANDITFKLLDTFDKLEEGKELSIEALQMVFRDIHTLKGNSRAVGFEDMAAVFHLFENIFLQLKTGKASLNENIIEIVYKVLVTIQNSLEVYRANLSAHIDFSELLGQLENFDKVEPKKVRTYKIAIIDDDESTREILSETLKLEFEAEFFEYGDADQILKDMHTTKFDLILTDYKMPILDGNTFIKNLRLTQNVNSETPIMFITGERPEITSNDKVNQDVYYIQKPFEFRRIIYYAKLSLFKI